VKPQNYRKLYLLSLYLATSTIDDISVPYHRHLKGWIFDDNEMPILLEKSNEKNSLEDAINLFSEVIHFRLNASSNIISEIQKQKPSFWPYSRIRSYYHSNIVPYDIATVDRNFIDNPLRSLTDRFKCRVNKCINFFDPKTIKPRGVLKPNRYVGSKRYSDTDSSFVIPDKRAKLTFNDFEKLSIN